MTSREKCIALWDKYNVPENVRKHSLQVEKVAVLLAEKIKKNGLTVDVGKVSGGALLHDIGKIISINQGKREDIVSKKILEEERLPELARIAEMHMVSRIMDAGFSDCSLEEKIVYYADKRVKHDAVVSVGERIRDLSERYPLEKRAGSVSIFKQCLPKILGLEKELFRKAKIKNLGELE